MATRYADRAFVSVNGAKLFDVQNASLRQNFNSRPVQSMTPDRNNRGFVQGNKDIDINIGIALQEALARPKLEKIDFAANDIQLTFLCGAEKFICTGLFIKSADDTAGGVGDEVKTAFNLGALKVQDAVGNSVLFNINLE